MSYQFINGIILPITLTQTHGWLVIRNSGLSLSYYCVTTTRYLITQAAHHGLHDVTMDCRFG